MIVAGKHPGACVEWRVRKIPEMGFQLRHRGLHYCVLHCWGREPSCVILMLMLGGLAGCGKRSRMLLIMLMYPCSCTWFSVLGREAVWGVHAQLHA